MTDDQNTKKKSTRRLINVPPRLNEMIEELMEAQGYPTFTALVHAAVIEKHTKAFPAYARPAGERETPKDRVARKQEEKAAKLEAREEEMVGICDALGGDVYDSKGTKRCKYFTYHNRKRYEQDVPLTMLTESMIGAQYSPSREKVEQLQAEGKTDY